MFIYPFSVKISESNCLLYKGLRRSGQKYEQYAPEHNSK